MRSLVVSISVERLIVAFIIALVIHLLIWQISFEMPKGVKLKTQPVKIMLLPRRTPSPSTKADALANVTQEGGGENKENITPATPVQAPFPDQVCL